MKKIKLIAMFLMMFIITVGCTQNEETELKEIEKVESINPNNINLTMVKPKTINPINNDNKSVGYILNLIYDGLFIIDENYNVVPQLVKEYGIHSDSMAIDIKLKDAKWHDGTNLTSDDVKFSVDTIKNNSNSPYNPLVQNISYINIKNNKEFTIKFKERYPFSIDTLIFPIVSKKELKGVNDANSFKNNLIGNGQYKIVNYEERKNMYLEVNKDYYEDIEPKIKKINVEIVPDETAQVAMVVSLNSDISEVYLNDLSKFYENEFEITNFEGRDYEGVLFNYDNPFLRDSNFRKAIASSIDRKKILEEAYMSDATLVNFPLNSKSKYYDTELKPYENDKDKANEYLNKVKAVKSTDINNNSSNTNVNTNESKSSKTETAKEQLKKINLKIIVSKENSERLKTAHLISEGLKSIGIKSTISELSYEDMDKAITDKEYDLALVGWELSSVPDATNIIRSIGYTDAKLESYLNSLMNATTENQIKSIYKSIQKYINDNVLCLSLVIRNDYIVNNNRLKGSLLPNSFDIYEGIKNLEIKY